MDILKIIVQVNYLYNYTQADRDYIFIKIVFKSFNLLFDFILILFMYLLTEARQPNLMMSVNSRSSKGQVGG